MEHDFTEFERQLIDAIRRVRQDLQVLEDIGNVNFDISVSGRLHTGELKVEFGVGEYASTVRGTRIASVLEEFKRREGWKRTNTPLMIGFDSPRPGDGGEEEEEEEDFPI